MKGLIIAAGRGSRLEHLTDSVPKPLVNVGNSCFFQNTIDHLISEGVNDIGAIVGYKKEVFAKYSNVKFYNNHRWASNNSLHSLFCARDFMDEDIVIAYGDIWFDKGPIRKILKSNNDITISVDKDWVEYYDGRSDHPINEAENVHYNNGLYVTNIGKHIYKSEDYNVGEFMGLLKISSNAIKGFVEEYEHLEESIRNTDSFQTSDRFENAYLTDFIKYLVDKSYDIRCDINQRGWSEVDTLQDLENLKRSRGIQ
jgi:choline kinase